MFLQTVLHVSRYADNDLRPFVFCRWVVLVIEHQGPTVVNFPDSIDILEPERLPSLWKGAFLVLPIP